MKYFCLAEKDQEASIFLFPRELDDKSTEEVITRGLRNQTFGNWRRFQFDIIFSGEISFNDVDRITKMLDELKDADIYQKMDSLYIGKVNVISDLKMDYYNVKHIAVDHQEDVCSLINKQLQENMKYICVLGNDGKEYIYLFPKYVHHDAMEEVIADLSYAMDSCRYEDILSAGFVNSKFECFGESETLGTVSRMDADTKILHKQLRVE